MPRSCSGDNIYPNGPTGGADGVSDAKRFDEILLEPYKDFGSIAPDFRIYATLGNHDWRTSREAALSEVRYLETTKPFYMDGIFYRVSPPGRPDVEMFVLDTEVLLAGETVYEAELADDGSELPGAHIGRAGTLDEAPERTRTEHGRVARTVFAAIHSALEDRHGASSDLVIGRQQVPAGSRPSPPDPADNVQICGHVPGRA